MKKIHELMNEVSTGAITNEEYTNEYRQIHLVAMQGDMDTVNDLIAFRKESVERSKQKQERVNNTKHLLPILGAMHVRQIDTGFSCPWFRGILSRLSLGVQRGLESILHMLLLSSPL